MRKPKTAFTTREIITIWDMYEKGYISSEIAAIVIPEKVGTEKNQNIPAITVRRVYTRLKASVAAGKTSEGAWKAYKQALKIILDGTVEKFLSATPVNKKTKEEVPFSKIPPRKPGGRNRITGEQLAKIWELRQKKYTIRAIARELYEDPEDKQGGISMILGRLNKIFTPNDIGGITLEYRLARNIILSKDRQSKLIPVSTPVEEPVVDEAPIEHTLAYTIPIVETPRSNAETPIEAATTELSRALANLIKVTIEDCLRGGENK